MMALRSLRYIRFNSGFPNFQGLRFIVEMEQPHNHLAHITCVTSNTKILLRKQNQFHECCFDLNI